MITSIAEQLKEALRRKGWSIKQAAEESNVDRSFLNRLIRGGEPPRTRSGRHTAEHDERYSRLAKALGLDVEVFIANARRVQMGTEKADLPDHGNPADRTLTLDAPIQRALRAGGLRALQIKCQALLTAL